MPIDDPLSRLSPEEFERTARHTAQLAKDLAEKNNRTVSEKARRILAAKPGEIADRRRAQLKPPNDIDSSEDRVAGESQRERAVVGRPLENSTEVSLGSLADRMVHQARQNADSGYFSALMSELDAISSSLTLIDPERIAGIQRDIFPGQLADAIYQRVIGDFPNLKFSEVADRVSEVVGPVRIDYVGPPSLYRAQGEAERVPHPRGRAAAASEETDRP
ncbi:hypothetical protein MLGJGCBP_00433 [Rhodococcus sp. T7]|nr:hypothetical protein MLGJGCBP_00433 [Rhodococcus sp. T7]